MVSIDQVANGLLIYARDYLIGQIPKNNPKYVFGNVGLELIGLAINQRKDALMKWANTKLSDGFWTMFSDFITPDGMVDIETLKGIFPKYIQPEGFKLPVPWFGAFYILPNDIDVIYNCITNCPTTPLGIEGGAKQL